jgi:NTE family protein
MPQTFFKTALVLSGGSARGLTHLGVLEEVEKHKIRVDMIVGTSMGAVIGGLYACYGDIRVVIRKIRELLVNELFLQTLSIASEDIPAVIPESFLHRFIWLFRRGVFYTHSMTRPTLVAESTYSEIMRDLIPEYNIEDLPVPFAAVAMDMISGEEIVLTKGSLRKAVSASAAIPGILPSVELNGRTLVDGGWIDNVPVAPAIALGAHFVIAVDASLDIQDIGPLPTTAIESLFRCNEITRITLDHHRRAFADVLLTPRVGQINWADFSGMDRCLPAGRAALEANLDRIRLKRMLRRSLSLGGLLHPARSANWHYPFAIL